MKTRNKQEILIALKKAQSHITKIIEMVDGDEYCIDIIQQLNAVDGYISSARSKKLQDHLNSCFSEGMSTSDSRKKRELIEELLRALRMTK